MGLNIPEDLRAWRRWQARRRRVQQLRSALSRPDHRVTSLAVVARGDDPQVLVALDSRSPSGIASLHGLFDRVDDLAIASSVHTAAELQTMLGRGESRVTTLDRLHRLRVVAASGHYLPAGDAAWRLAMQRDLPNIVVQHGLMTPFAPPLPPRAHVLAFSDADGRFWASGRADVSWQVTGSQLLWDASRQRATQQIGGAPYFLGQLHGAELPRPGMSRAVVRFWRETNAVYRPHPSEIDRLSRIQHRVWERRGMRIDRSHKSIGSLGGPVVAAFSTGIVESAAAGLPAWSFYPDAPDWVEDFWHRYGISRWGLDSTPTPPPAQPLVEPAAAIADAVLEIAGGRR